MAVTKQESDNQELDNKESDSWLTIAKLKEIIKNLPDDMLVGRLDWYGDFRPMYTNDLFQHEAPVYDIPGKPWLPENRYKLIMVLAIEPPDIGEEPD